MSTPIAKTVFSKGLHTFLLLLFALSIPLVSTTDADAKRRKFRKTLTLYVGVFHDEKIPKAPNGFSKSGTYKAISRLQFDPNSKTLRINPKKVGVGTLFIKNPRTGKIIYQYHINIIKTNLYKVAKEIRNLLREVDGITIRIVNNRVVVDGEILLPRDLGRIHSVIKQFGNQASSLVRLSPRAQAKIAQFIERDINNPEITVKAVNGKFFLEGVANDADEKAKAEIIAKAYVPDVVIDEAVADKKVLQRKHDVVVNLIKLKPPGQENPKKIIELVVHYVELQKDYSKGFRFQWTPDIGDGSTVKVTSGGDSKGGIVSTITGTITNLLPKLNWAKEHGHARVLQSSSLKVEDGQSGTLNSLSRIPYQIVNADGQPSTNFEEAGIRTNITPLILGRRSDSIKLNINFSIKSLISITEQGPLTSSREIKTTLVVRSGASAAVGGLISNDSGTHYNKLPPNVSRNPLISLYASKSFRRSQSQFVMFVTPIIKSSASAGADKIKRKFRLKY
ncbi:BON domain-containing protein [Bdellovibrionales bacterium]|nr:BON domain-containing protein [Bdellovibrionales bacterium]